MINFLTGDEIGGWIQVDLLKPTQVSGIVTQGRGVSAAEQWVTSYEILYGNNVSNLAVLSNLSGAKNVVSPSDYCICSLSPVKMF